MNTHSIQRKKHSEITSAKLDRFVEYLATNGNISQSARLAGVSRRYVYDMLQKDEQFRGRVDEALDESVERLEQIARDRAEAGSDLMLIFLLKALRPHKYREKPAIINNAPTSYVIDLGADS